MLIPLRDNLKISTFPLLTLLLIALNCVMFFGWQGGSNLSEDKVVLYSVVPYEVTHPGEQCVPKSADGFLCDDEEKLESRYGIEFPNTATTIVSSMFMHGSILHLVGNMIFLFAFGVALEGALGRVSFMLFYLAGGFGAELGHTLFDPSSPIPSLGASGAISAVMAGYVMLFPRAKVLTLILVIPAWVRAWMLITLLMFMQVVQVYFLLTSEYGVSGGGVAYFAHFGGFLTGIALLKVVADRSFIDEQRELAKRCSGDTIATPLDPATALAYAQQAPAVPAQPGPAATVSPPASLAEAPPPAPAPSLADMPPPQTYG